MSTEMRASVLLTLKDQLTAAASKLGTVFKPLEGGVKTAVETLKTLGKSGDEVVAALDKIGAAAEAMGGKAQKGAKDVADAIGKIKKSSDEAAARPKYDMSGGHTAEYWRDYWDKEHPRRQAEKAQAQQERDRASRELRGEQPGGGARGSAAGSTAMQERVDAARAQYGEAKGKAAFGVGLGKGLAKPPVLAAAAQEQASAKIQMITDMDAATRAYFDRAMLKLQETNIYDMKHSYDAAEKAARLSVYADALKDNIKQYGDTTTAREKSADTLVHWVDDVEKYSMLWKMLPGATSEKLKHIKNQFHLDEEGVRHVADVNSLLANKYGFKQSDMVAYMTTAGAALKQMGFSTEQTMALGVGPLQKGINPSSTGTNLTQILNYMQTARSPKAKQAFEMLMGQTQAQFNDSVKKAPWLATMDFLSVAKEAMKTDKGRAQLTAIIGTHQLKNLANVTEALDVASAAYKTSHSDEVHGYADTKAKELREATLVHKWAMLKNSLVGGESMIGRVFLPHLKDGVDWLRGWLNARNAAMRESEAKGTGGNKTAAYGVAAGAGLLAAGGILSMLRFGGKLAGLTMLKNLPGIAGAAALGLKAAFGGMTKLAGGAAAGIRWAFMGLGRFTLVGGILTAGYLIVTHWSEIKGKLTGLWADIKGAYNAAMGHGVASPESRDAHGKLGQTLLGPVKAGAQFLAGYNDGKPGRGLIDDVWDALKDAPGVAGKIWDAKKRDWGGGVAPADVMQWHWDEMRYGPPKGWKPPGGGRGAPYKSGARLGPEVPTLVGGRMAEEAQGGLPAGVTIQANGPQVNFRQAPPSITTHVTVNVAQTNASPAEIGAAVARAATPNIGGGALYDGAQ